MEWVETTGKTVDEAKEAALDELGVDEVDAEFEVVAEPQTGLFGRLRSEARIRARVMPTAPRAKEDRRDRRRRSTQASKGATTETAGEGSVDSDSATDQGGSATKAPREPKGSEKIEAASEPGAKSATETAASSNGSARSGRSRSGGGGGRNRGGRSSNRSGEAGEDDLPYQSKGAEVEVALEEQAAIAVEFLTQLTAEFGLSASVTVANPDEDTAELQLNGSDLGLLIGPKGATLVALQSLVRTAVFHATNATNGHINVDIGGYRHKRTEALVRFANQVAAQVQGNGKQVALEPMSAVDRKVVHDAIGKIDGVATTSEGEEPRRRVVVMPAASAD